MAKSVFFWVLFFTYLVIPRQMFAHTTTQIIEMTPQGFSPQQITVDENASILFVNNDMEDRWPASNVHPTHDLYPEFDPREPIKPKGSWVFKPKRIGEWKYHDHLFPHMRGSISVVLEQKKTPVKDSPLENFIRKAQNTLKSVFEKVSSLFSPRNVHTQEKLFLTVQAFRKLSFSKQEEELQLIAQTGDATRVWRYIKDVFKHEAGSSGNVHDLAHLAGILLYEKKGFGGIKDCSTEFAFGCYHGFLDKAFAKNLDHLLEAEKSCLTLGPKNSGPVASCIHGIGHGVASFYATSNVEKSLSTCRKLSSGNEYCFDGVFMEFVRSASDAFFKKDDPYYPCNSLEKKFGYTYSFSCGRNQPSLLMGRFRMGFDEVVSVCTASDSKPFTSACVDSLGFSLAATGDVAQILAGCQKIDDEVLIARCVKAAAGELVFQEVPLWFEKSQQVCAGIPQSQQECQEYLHHLIREYNKKISYQAKGSLS